MNLIENHNKKTYQLIWDPLPSEETKKKFVHPFENLIRTFICNTQFSDRNPYFFANYFHNPLALRR